MTATLLCIFLLISLSIGIGPTGDLTCKDHEEWWTAVMSDWEFSSECIYENIIPTNGAMSWLGDGLPESLEWSDYTVEVTMVPTNTEAGGANGGLAFNIQSACSGGNCGQYYAISLFPTYREDQVEVHLGKWNNNYQTKTTWFIDDVYTPGQEFDIRVKISTSVNVTVETYVNNILLGIWVEDTEPMWKHGSVGMRNYLLPARFTNMCVNGCNVLNKNEAASTGAWIFIGLVFGGLFLYCVIGYIINGTKSKDYKNVKGNIPHIQFWKVLPRLTIVGCQVSYEVTKQFLFRSPGKEPLMDTVGADADADADQVDVDDKML